MSPREEGRVIELLGPAAGGIRMHVGDLTRRLRSQGMDVVVAGPGGTLPQVGPPDHHVAVPAGPDPVGVVRATAALRRVPGALVHAHGLKAGWVAVLGGGGRPVVLTVHNLVLEETGGRSTALLHRLERGLMRRVDRMIAPNEAIARHCRAAAPHTPVQVIVPCSPAPVSTRSRAAVRRDLGVADDAPLVVVVARLHPQKDLPTFLSAMDLVVAAMPGARAVVAGDGPLRDALDRTIRDRGLAPAVTLLGARDDVADLLAAADVMALSSRWEAIPLAVVEAVLLGCPVVSTDVGIVDQLVAGGENGVVVPVGDATAMAAALLDVLGQDDVAGRRTRVRRSAERLVGGDHLATQVRHVYEQVLAPAGAEAPR